MLALSGPCRSTHRSHGPRQRSIKAGQHLPLWLNALLCANRRPPPLREETSVEHGLRWISRRPASQVTVSRSVCRPSFISTMRAAQTFQAQILGVERDPLRSCIAALHKMCLRIAQLLANKPAADARDGFLPFHRIGCSPLKVLTFTPKGPRFSDGPIFLAVGTSLIGTPRDRHFHHQVLGVISPWRNRPLPTKA